MAHAAGIYWNLPVPTLIVRLIERRENKKWNPNAESEAGAVGLAQIKPGTVCRYTPGCYAKDEAKFKERLGKIALALRDPRYNLCWSGKILHELSEVCGNGGIGCTVSSYYNGEVGAIYTADVLR